ncbi:MAG: rod shape-determining protein RodA [Candidatus Kapaibacteriales bacterium]
MMSRDLDIRIDDNRPSVIFDFKTTIIVLGLIVIGLMSIYSSTATETSAVLFTKQLVSTGIGVVIMLITAFLPKQFIKTSSWFVYGLSLALLGTVLAFGKSVYGTKGWLVVGGLSIQPAELAKVGVIMAIALWLSRPKTDINNPKDFIICCLFLAAPLALIVRQPDIGSASVLGIIFLGILFWSGFSLLFIFTVVSLPISIIAALNGEMVFFITASVLVLTAAFIKSKIWAKILGMALIVAAGFAAPMVFDKLEPHQQSRIETFIDPASNPLGSGYNVIQSQTAVGSGGIWGKGYLEGTQTQLRYVPMQWTEFIFSVPAEEFGLIGGIVVILLQVLLIYRCFQLALQSTGPYYSIVSFAIGAMFFYHILINIGMAIGVMPVMGIPLPFMSYGGTNMILNLFLIGLLINVYRDKEKAKHI